MKSSMSTCFLCDFDPKTICRLKANVSIRKISSPDSLLSRENLVELTQIEVSVDELIEEIDKLTVANHQDLIVGF